MNNWTELSIQYANQRNCLDDLFRVYSLVPDKIRDIDEHKWGKVEKTFHQKDDVVFLNALLDLSLFPIKDSYVAYLKRDRQAIARNPKTVSRLCSTIREMGLDKIWERCSEPKETNRQIGPLFSRWLQRKELGFPLMEISDFSTNLNDAILDGPDATLSDFARSQLGYTGNKGLDFLARVNGKYIIGEAKFLTDWGGHQNAQFEDAKNLLNASVKAGVIKIAILDGVLYIPSKNKMYRFLTEHEEQYNILSCLLLRNFLYQI